MAVVGLQILREFGPGARIQDPSLHEGRKDADEPVAFSNGHLVDPTQLTLKKSASLPAAATWHWSGRQSLFVREGPGPQRTS